MAGGYENLAGDPFEELKRQLSDVLRRLSELERPTGAQVYDSLKKLTDLVNSFPAQLAALSASGQTWQGPVSSGAGNITTTTGYVFTPAGYAFDITYTRRGAWLGNDGRLGWASSSITAKELIETIPEPDALRILEITSKHYHRKVELAKRDDPDSEGYVGPDYRVATEWGTIAEHLHDLGLWQVVIYEWDSVWDLRDVLDGDGNPIVNHDGDHLKERVPGSERRVEGAEARPVGVHYELIGLLAIIAVRYVNSELASVRDDVSELKRIAGI